MFDWKKIREEEGMERREWGEKMRRNNGQSHFH